MPYQTCMGATLRCSFGMTPSELVVLPLHRVLTNERPDANIGDHTPLVNILPFGMCLSVANPEAEAATAAALGVPMPVPCIPATPMPWISEASTVLLDGLPSLSSDSKLMCLRGGVITFVQPVEKSVIVP